MNFDQAFALLIDHEGGYTSGNGDPGGETKFGISKRSYPNLDIKALTLADAKEIYLRDFWQEANMDNVPDWSRFEVFDTAVNSGISTAKRLMQRALGVAEDGYIGPVTFRALARMDPWQFNSRFNAVRLDYMTRLSNWPIHGRGWARRIAQNLMQVEQ